MADGSQELGHTAQPTDRSHCTACGHSHCTACGQLTLHNLRATLQVGDYPLSVVKLIQTSSRHVVWCEPLLDNSDCLRVLQLSLLHLSLGLGCGGAREYVSFRDFLKLMSCILPEFRGTSLQSKKFPHPLEHLNEFSSKRWNVFSQRVM